MDSPGLLLSANHGSKSEAVSLEPPAAEISTHGRLWTLLQGLRALRELPKTMHFPLVDTPPPTPHAKQTGFWDPVAHVSWAVLPCVSQASGLNRCQTSGIIAVPTLLLSHGPSLEQGNRSVSKGPLS